VKGGDEDSMSRVDEEDDDTEWNDIDEGEEG